MANRWFKQFTSSLIPKLCVAYGDVVIGTSGAVASSGGNGIYAVTKLATGIYQIQLNDTFNAFLDANFTLEAGIGSNSNVSDGSFVANTLYQIQTVGTTNWHTLGLNSGLTAAVGQNFVATTSDGSGNGVGKAISPTGILAIEVIRNEQVMLPVNSPSSPSKGSLVVFQCINSSNALANPLIGSRIRFSISLRNSFLSA
jgi:hypothetical protein